jgi:hypothetical protein
MSSQLSKRHTFSSSCSSREEWYACGSGSRFVGCCTTNPCTSGCAQGNLRSVTFLPSEYATFPDASCGGSSDFFSCLSGNRTFWGCCKSNPCANNQTCPAGDLVPAFMERPEQYRTYLSDRSAAKHGHPNKTKYTGARVGGAVGGGLGLSIIVTILLIFLCRRHKQDRKHKDSIGSGPSHHSSTGGSCDQRTSAQVDSEWF